VWDASTGIVLPHPQIAAHANTPRPAMDEPMMAGWFTNTNTGRYMGALPVGANYYCGQVHGSTYVGWTLLGYEPVVVHFPEQ
jgi:hypothetical protein